MNREDIIRMAIEAEINLYVNDLTEKQYIEVIERFAALVASAERNRTWVGLTKKEFQEAVEGLEDLEDCWVAIESALRSKND